MASLSAVASPPGLRALFDATSRHRSKRVPTILAPALPALVLLAITTAGIVDPPRAGLVTQLHLTSVTTSATIITDPLNTQQSTGSLPVTPR